MGAVTWAQATAQLAARIRLLHETMRYGSQVAADYITVHDALLALAVYNYGAGVKAESEIARGVLSSMLGPNAVQSAISRCYPDIRDAINAPNRRTLFDSYREDVYEYMITNSEFVESRVMTYGTPALGGGNVGTGAIYRVTEDENGYDLEWCPAQAFSAEVVLDQGLRRPLHQEIWQIKGVAPSKDFLSSPIQSGLVRRFQSVDRETSARYLTNPGFDQFTGTQPTAGTPSTPSAADSVTGWTLDTPANYRVGIDTPAVFRGAQGESTPKWLQFTANGLVTQTLRSNRIPRFIRRRPFLYGIAVYRESSADGTITLRLGTTTQTFAVTSLNNAAWNIIALDRDKDLYYRNFREDALTVEIEWTGRTVGDLYFDDTRFCPFDAWAGTWIKFVGGATPWIQGDTATWTDSEADVDGGKIQKWHMRADMVPEGECFTLPSATGSAITVADPA